MLNKRISKYPNKILQVKFCEYKSINDSIESEDILKKKTSFQSQLKQYKNSSINTSNNKLKKNFVSLLIQTTSQVIKFVRRSGIRGAAYQSCMQSFETMVATTWGPSSRSKFSGSEEQIADGQSVAFIRGPNEGDRLRFRVDDRRWARSILAIVTPI